LFFIGIGLFVNDYLAKTVLQYTSYTFIILNLIITFIELKYFLKENGLKCKAMDIDSFTFYCYIIATTSIKIQLQYELFDFTMYILY
jgi:hypothetical protein